MFTSRAEHRLALRIDNADLRLTPLGRAAGLIDDGRWERFVERRARFAENIERVRSVRLPSTRDTAWAAVQRGTATIRGLVADGLLALATPASPVLDMSSVEAAVRYDGYLQRQEAELARAERDERRPIPAGFEFDRVPGLSREVVERLSTVRPHTIGQASRVPGVTPAAAAVVAVFVRRFRSTLSASPTSEP
jgi:tRNA uridine 5-carboxymethylaminomethyl modification enzyme